MLYLNTLYLSYCNKITDILMLYNLHILYLSYCDKIKDVYVL